MHDVFIPSIHRLFDHDWHPNTHETQENSMNREATQETENSTNDYHEYASTSKIGRAHV